MINTPYHCSILTHRKEQERLGISLNKPLESALALNSEYNGHNNELLKILPLWTNFILNAEKY